MIKKSCFGKNLIFIVVTYNKKIKFMSEVTQFSEEEVSKINELRTKFQTIIIQLGQIELDRKLKLKEYDEFEEKLLAEHSELVKEERELFSEIEKKYGEGEYDITTNTFTPKK